MLNNRRGLKGIELARLGDSAGISLAFAFNTGGPVVLRERLDGRVLLAALVDAGGDVIEWLEVAVQSASRLADAPLGTVITNPQLDARWAAEIRALRAAGASLVATGAESHPAPVLTLDRQARIITHVQGPSGSALRLCQDEATLASAGLSPYAASLDRYLADGTTFVAVAGGSTGQSALRPTDLGLIGAGLDPINLEGGIMYARSLLHASYEAACDWLSGAPPSLAVGSPDSNPWAEVSERLADAFLAELGEPARLLESLYLRLSLFVDALDNVARATASLKRPMLSLSPESFRVGLPDHAGHALPARWALRVELMDTGVGYAIGARGGSGGFAPIVALDASPYRSPALTRVARGSGSMRLRRVLIDSGTTVVLEATLTAQQRVLPAPGDVISLRFALEGQAFDLESRIDPSGSVGFGEWRVRTIEKALDVQAVELLKRAQGQTVPDALFDLAPALSTPCDLHSMGVLAVRTLLVNGQRHLGVALDDLMSMARRTGTDSQTTLDSLARAIETELRTQPGSASALGPVNLAHEPTHASVASAVVPLQVWAQILAACAALIPGLTPASWCAEAGAAPPASPERVYDAPLAEFRRLARVVRSLLVCDWSSNREIDAVVRELEAASFSYHSPDTRSKGNR